MILGLHLSLPDLLIQCGQLGGQMIHISNGIAKLCIALLRQPLQPIGKLMERESVGETTRYFDEFYQTLRTPQQAARNVFDRCVGPR